MYSLKDLRSYQKEGILHVLYHPNAMLWLQMGLGKTIIMLTALTELMRSGRVTKTIIFGPIKVVESVWPSEIRKWEHTSHLICSVMTGSEEERLRALFRKADIYLINYENMSWLSGIFKRYFADKGKENPFQCVIYDEVSKLKDSGSVRMAGGKVDKDEVVIKKHGWREILPSIPYRYGLTGTPASNGYIDLHGQYLAVDNGKRLGTSKTSFRQRFFTSDYFGRKFFISDTSRKALEAAIADITLKMDAKDYLDMPKLNVVDVFVKLPANVEEKYRQLEKELFTELDSGTEIELFNAQSLSNKCLQFCNGNPYTSVQLKTWESIHKVKLDALEEILEQAGGQPILCSYSFVSDAEKIMSHFKKYKPVNLTAEKASKTSLIIDKWNRGEIRLLIGHPASMGHGIDGLQHGGSLVVWFGLNWSLELYEQMNGRIYRSGQSKPVTVLRILCEDTIDMAVKDAIENKYDTQEGLKNSIEKYRAEISPPRPLYRLM